MAQFINHYSFLIFLMPATTLALFILLRGKGARWKQLLSVILVLGAAVLFFVFNPGETVTDASEARDLVATAGKPILLEFYSDY